MASWFCWSIQFLLIWRATFVSAVVEPSIKECIKAAGRMARTGNGSTPTSCMSCDPTHGICQPKCQNKVNYLYYACDDICLPDGYFFDPPQYLDGCWKNVKRQIKFAVERCGCNSASQLSPIGLWSLTLGLVVCLFFMLDL